MVELKNLIGMQFGRLTVIERAEKIGKKPVTAWLCACTCGNVKKVKASYLQCGGTTSCGCLRRKKERTSTYTAWKNMRQRCLNEKRPDFKYYGERGISICKEWNSYERFLDDMGERPEGMELGRIDNDGGYAKDNCRWETRKQQNNNTRKSRKVTIGGETLTVAEWQDKQGFSKNIIYDRLNKLAWGEFDAVVTPTRPVKGKGGSIKAALAGLIMLLSGQSFAADIVGSASVIDGDTIVIGGRHIRLSAIDAPESRQVCTTVAGLPYQCGKRATEALTGVIGGRPVVCSGDVTDRYGRLVAVCYVDGGDLIRWMVELGWAVAYRQYSLMYVDAETEARAAGRGLWQGTFDMPWDWRKQK